MIDDEKIRAWPKWSDMDDTGKGMVVMVAIFLVSVIWTWIA